MDRRQYVDLSDCGYRFCLTAPIFWLLRWLDKDIHVSILYVCVCVCVCMYIYIYLDSTQRFGRVSQSLRLVSRVTDWLDFIAPSVSCVCVFWNPHLSLKSFSPSLPSWLVVLLFLFYLLYIFIFRAQHFSRGLISGESSSRLYTTRQIKRQNGEKGQMDFVEKRGKKSWKVDNIHSKPHTWANISWKISPRWRNKVILSFFDFIWINKFISIFVLFCISFRLGLPRRYRWKKNDNERSTKRVTW